jgi:hypothetical protein
MKEFPVHSTEHDWRKTVPLSLLSDNESRAKRNHSQSLKRLAERGGLGAIEIFAIARDVPYTYALDMEVTKEEAQAIIDRWIKADCKIDAGM